MLLIQIRDEDMAIEQELECFLEASLLEMHQTVVFNVVREQVLKFSWDEIDMVIIGGAGAFSVTEEQYFYPLLNAMLDEICKRRIPLFGSCWGHQYLGRYFGGKVETRPDAWEFGSHKITLNETGKTDPIFSMLDDFFWANQGHADQIVELPDVLLNMAETSKCKIQAVKHRELPMYGTQFHPELNKHRFQERMIMYKKHYNFETEEAFWEAYHATHETRQVSRLIQRFMEEFVAYQELIA